MAIINKPSQPLIPPTDVEEVEEIATNAAAAAIAADDTHAPLVDDKVPAANLPSYVDDVLNFDSADAFPEEGEEGKIYVANDTNLTYRWSGAAYIQVGDASLAAGDGIEIENDIVSVDEQYLNEHLEFEAPIDDLSTIRSGAAAGTSAKEVSDELTDNGASPVYYIHNPYFSHLTDDDKNVLKSVYNAFANEKLPKLYCASPIVNHSPAAVSECILNYYDHRLDILIPYAGRSAGNDGRETFNGQIRYYGLSVSNDQVYEGTTIIPIHPYKDHKHSWEQWDDTPTANSTKVITSGSVYDALAPKANSAEVNTALEAKVDKPANIHEFVVPDSWTPGDFKSLIEAQDSEFIAYMGGEPVEEEIIANACYDQFGNYYNFMPDPDEINHYFVRVQPVQIAPSEEEPDLGKVSSLLTATISIENTGDTETGEDYVVCSDFTPSALIDGNQFMEGLATKANQSDVDKIVGFAGYLKKTGATFDQASCDIINNLVEGRSYWLLCQGTSSSKEVYLAYIDCNPGLHTTQITLYAENQVGNETNYRPLYGTWISRRFSRPIDTSSPMNWTYGIAPLGEYSNKTYQWNDSPQANSTSPVTSRGIYNALQAKQDTLVSATNIKTINGESILGSGNLEVGGNDIPLLTLTPTGVDEHEMPIGSLTDEQITVLSEIPLEVKLVMGDSTPVLMTFVSQADNDQGTITDIDYGMVAELVSITMKFDLVNKSWNFTATQLAKDEDVKQASAIIEATYLALMSHSPLPEVDGQLDGEQFIPLDTKSWSETWEKEPTEVLLHLRIHTTGNDYVSVGDYVLMRRRSANNKGMEYFSQITADGCQLIINQPSVSELNMSYQWIVPSICCTLPVPDNPAGGLYATCEIQDLDSVSVARVPE